MPRSSPAAARHPEGDGDELPVARGTSPILADEARRTVVETVASLIDYEAEAADVIFDRTERGSGAARGRPDRRRAWRRIRSCRRAGRTGSPKSRSRRLRDHVQRRDDPSRGTSPGSRRPVNPPRRPDTSRGWSCPQRRQSVKSSGKACATAAQAQSSSPSRRVEGRDGPSRYAQHRDGSRHGLPSNDG